MEIHNIKYTHVFSGYKTDFVRLGHKCVQVGEFVWISKHLSFNYSNRKYTTLIEHTMVVKML